jgi:tripartite ATP-independent transporter DctP family solute receptor
MKRRELLLAAGAGLVPSTWALGASNAGKVMTAADVHINGYPTVEAVRWMGQRIEQQTQGRLSIRVYHSGQLGRESDTVDLARSGALDITRVNFGPLGNPFPLTQIFVLPYLFESVDHMRRAVDGAVGKTVLQGFQSRNLIGLAIYDAGVRNFYNVRRPIQVPADLHGLKIRVPPSDTFIDMARALGANPTPLPYGEVYSALQTGLIDGAENNWRSFQSSRQFEVARYLSESGHSVSPEALLMSRRTFSALLPADQEVVLAAARDSVGYMRNLWDQLEAQARSEVIKAGVQVNQVERAAFQRAAQATVDGYVAQGGLKKLYEQVRALA